MSTCTTEDPKPNVIPKRYSAAEADAILAEAAKAYAERTGAGFLKAYRHIAGLYPDLAEVARPTPQEKPTKIPVHVSARNARIYAQKSGEPDRVEAVEAAYTKEEVAGLTRAGMGGDRRGPEEGKHHMGLWYKGEHLPASVSRDCDARRAATYAATFPKLFTGTRTRRRKEKR